MVSELGLFLLLLSQIKQGVLQSPGPVGDGSGGGPFPIFADFPLLTARTTGDGGAGGGVAGSDSV
jgi:hypothetical protein